MFAIDTNIVVRLLTNDDPDQSEKARSLLSRERVFVSLTVMLEAEWVLRSAYGLDRLNVARAFRAFAGLPQVVVQDPPSLEMALTWAEAGMDFADALHLAQSGASKAFLTFDDRFAKAAKRTDAFEVKRI
jgi:predicted nucleic-acid-binding protein